MAENRLSRELESHTKAERPKQWVRPETLPQPDKQAGYRYKWIRISPLGQADARNISSKLREGYEPGRIEEQPQFQMLVDPNSRFKDNVEVAGLLLCKIPEEMAEQRNEYFAQQTQAQIESVDNNFMRENDPRMPLFRERKSSASFGKGK